MGLRVALRFLSTKCLSALAKLRIEDLRAAAEVVKGKLAGNVKLAMVVPDSGLVKKQAESEGLDSVFTDAGFSGESRCSMCLAMNDDRLDPGDDALQPRTETLRASRAGSHSPFKPCNGCGCRCGRAFC